MKIEQRKISSLKPAPYNPRQAGIYLISFENTSKTYVGSAVNLSKRFSNHKCDLKNGTHCNKHMQHVYNKYGNPKFEILLFCDKEDLLTNEQKYYNELMPELNIVKDITRGNIENHTPEDLVKITEFNRNMSKTMQWREKVSKTWFKTGKRILTDEQRKLLSENGRNSFLGKTHTKETRKKMSEKAKNRDYSNYDFVKWQKGSNEVTRKPIVKKDKNGNIITKYESITQAIQQIGTTQSRQLLSCCRNEREYYKGFKWEFTTG